MGTARWSWPWSRVDGRHDDHADRQPGSDFTETLTVTSISGNTVYFTPSLSFDHNQNSVATWAATDVYPLTEARYRTCATWNMTTAHKDNLSTIRNCFDGWVAPREDGALVAIRAAITPHRHRWARCHRLL
jgi:hypothetical protein